MKVSLTPNEVGVGISFDYLEGKNSTSIPLPLSNDRIIEYYKLPGFMVYLAWEQLYELGVLEDDNTLSYPEYYRLLGEEDGVDLLHRVGLPTEPMRVNGELRLDSMPQEARLSVLLQNSDGKNLDRLGKRTGAFYEIEGELKALPEAVYHLYRAIQEPFDEGYQKIAICQELAQQAGLKMENFLQNERFHVIDRYDLEVKVHSDDHIELVPTGDSAVENLALNHPAPVYSAKAGLSRERYVRTKRVDDDLHKMSTKRHIRGQEVPLFFENPSAVLPEHDYMIDLEEFSDRVKGLIPIFKVGAQIREGSGFTWFDKESGDAAPFDETLLRDLMERHPDQQYVNYEGKWFYLDPTLRKQLLGLDDGEKRVKNRFALDIKDNEDELDYQLEANHQVLVERYPIPSGLQATLFEHQMVGFHWLCQLHEQQRGGLLADDMGLGKTLQVIAFLLRQQELNMLKPTLLILPIALIENWVEEMRKFAPSLTTSMYIHRGSNRLASSERISQYDLVITSYDTLKIDQLIFGKIAFQSVICDEAQNVKSFSSQRSRALRAMKAEFRLAMTGTPVENGLDELWSIMDFVQPGYLGALKEFRKRYEEQADYEGLLRTLKPHYLRRTKKEVLANQLPIKYPDTIVFVEASSEQKALSYSMLQTSATGQTAILNMLTKLRQLYGHPGAVVPDYERLPIEQIPKIHMIVDQLDRIREKEEKVLIFTEFRKLHSIMKRILMQRYGISIPVIDGDTKNRRAVVQAFNESEGFGVMLLSPKAAGVGLTITSANHVIHYTRWWNPAVENQATDRAYRIGQNKDVYVYQFITRDPVNFPKGTVEEVMHELLENKRELAENVIVPFSVEEIRNLVMEKVLKKTE